MGKRVMQYRRKQDGRTDYKKRLSLLKSGLPRLVVRRSNNAVQAQLVRYEPDGDKVIATARSSDLTKHGWKGHTGNIPAAYLTGLMLAQSAKVSGDIILDIGLQQHHKGGRLYAVVKGAIDGGLGVRCSDNAFPPQERIQGEHIDSKLPAAFADMKVKIMSDTNG